MYGCTRICDYLPWEKLLYMSPTVGRRGCSAMYAARTHPQEVAYGEKKRNVPTMSIRSGMPKRKANRRYTREIYPEEPCASAPNGSRWPRQRRQPQGRQQQRCPWHRWSCPPSPLTPCIRHVAYPTGTYFGSLCWCRTTTSQ